MVLRINAVPESVDAGVVKQFLTDLGFEWRDVRRVVLGIESIEAEVFARDDKGHAVFADGGVPAVHTVSLPYRGI